MPSFQSQLSRRHRRGTQGIARLPVIVAITAALAVVALVAWLGSPEPQQIAPGPSRTLATSPAPQVAQSAPCCGGADAVEPPAPARVADPAAVAEFRRWAEGYAAAGAADIETGRRLAAARAEAMVALIRTNPKDAIAVALPYAVRKTLPPEIAARVEQPVRASGELMVLAVRPLPGQTVEEPIRRQVKAAGKTWRAYTYGRRLKQITTERMAILGVGITTASGENFLALREEPYEVLAKDEAADLKASGAQENANCPISNQPTTATSDETAVHVGEKVIWLCHGGHLQQWLQTPEGSSRVDLQACKLEYSIVSPK